MKIFGYIWRFIFYGVVLHLLAWLYYVCIWVANFFLYVFTNSTRRIKPDTYYSYFGDIKYMCCIKRPLVWSNKLPKNGELVSYWEAVVNFCGEYALYLNLKDAILGKKTIVKCSIERRDAETGILKFELQEPQPIGSPFPEFKAPPLPSENTGQGITQIPEISLPLVEPKSENKMTTVDIMYAEVAKISELYNDPAKEWTEREKTMLMRQDVFLRYMIENAGKGDEVQPFVSEFNL